MTTDTQRLGEGGIATEYRDAARRWFAGTAGPAAFRRELAGGAGERIAAWDAFRGFGLDEILAGAEPADQARIAAAVGIEAGGALYAGPLVEGCARALCGIGTAATKREIGAAFDHGALLTPLAAAPGPDGGLRVRGALRGIPYLDLAGSLIVPLRVRDAAAWWAVPLGAPGIAPAPDGQEAQVDGSVMAALTLDCGLAAGETLAAGPAAAACIEAYADLLLLSTSARLIGIAARAGDLTREYLGTRRQFGRVLGGFQALQHRAVDGHIEVTLASALLWRLAADWDTPGPRRTLLLALKSLASKTAMQLTRDGVQMFGAMGFSDEGPLGIYLKHALTLAARYGGEARSRALYAAQAVDLLQ